MIKKLLLACWICISLEGIAQDPHLTQYHSIPAYLNPGFTGSNGCGRAAAAYRNQWPAISGTFVNIHSSYEHYLHALRGGLGLSYMHDRAGEGTFITNRIELLYAAHLDLFDKKLQLRPGISLAYVNRNLNWGELTFGDMVDPRRGFVYTTAEQQGPLRRRYLDLSSGLVFQTRYVHGGAAVHHLTKPDEGFIGKSELPMKFTVHLAGMIGEPDSAKKLCFSPHVMFMKQQDFHQLLGGITAKYDKYILGIAYRNQDAIIAQAGFQTPLFRVSYSYDLTISKLSYATGGSHELTASFNILHRKDKKITPVRTIAF